MREKQRKEERKVSVAQSIGKEAQRRGIKFKKGGVNAEGRHRLWIGR